MTKLINYVGYLELRFKRTDIEDALARNEQDIAGLLRNEIIDEDLAEALRAINSTLARVARDVKRRRR